jgi:POTRA domain-containing FtsQ-type protein
MSRYQGKALEAPRAKRGRRKAASPLRLPLLVVAAMAALGALAMLPWGELRAKVFVVGRVRVTGLRYLDAEQVRRRSGLAAGQDLLGLDMDRARQLVLMEPRVREARVRHVGLRDLEIHVDERVPALLVEHGEPWEIDAAGVLLEPLEQGVVADVPLLTGPDLSQMHPGSQVSTVDVRRGLAWTAILSDNALRLTGQVSEVDVSDSGLTRLVLLNGVRVLAPVWPNGTRQLSGLRATLADLTAKGMTPREVDVRFKDQIVVRGAKPDGPAAATGSTQDI